MGAALFADISGFTPLTEALVQDLGPRGGADELTRQLNLVYDALIAEVHRYHGSVITFSGDAITCWFDDAPSPSSGIAPSPSSGIAPSPSSGIAPSTSSGTDPSTISGQAELRATACGLAMQEAMVQFASVETPSGRTVSLAMKAAVAAGPVRRFMVGDPEIQRMDVLAGATLDRMAAAEHLAQRGEVVIGAETAARLDDRVKAIEWREDKETSERFAVVGGLGEQVGANPWPALHGTDGEVGGLGEEQTRPWLLSPVYEKLKTGQGRLLAEMRPGVALFLRFGGLDYDQDEAAGDKLDAYLRWVQKVLARYEGYMFQLTLGDKGCYLYGAFGAPLAHDDDQARSVAAALELREPPADMDYITGVQIGISHGRMRAGAYGGSMRRTYGVLGDEVNLAARLMGKAEVGQILVSERIADVVAGSYTLDYIGLVKVKGKQEPLPVSRVVGRRQVSPQRPASLFSHRLVGRDDELAEMGQVLSSVLAGEGQILRLEGGAGVGKSRLAAEFVEQALGRGFKAALGGCQSISQDIAYHPWQQAFRALFELADEFGEGGERGAAPSQVAARQAAQVEATVRETNLDWLVRLPLLGDLLDLPIPDNEVTVTFDPRLRQESLFALAVEIVRAWALTQPLLLLIEDVHWMDEASMGMTLALGRALRDVPILLALVHRPPISGDQPLLPELSRLPVCHHMTLDELSPAGVGTLVTHRLQGEPSSLALDLIQAQAHGNPFFTEELVGALREAQDLYQQEDGTWTLSPTMVDGLQGANCLVKEGGEWALASDAQLSAADLGIPDSIHGVVLSRIDRLPEAHKVTMKAASVIGRIFEFDVLTQAHPARVGRDSLHGQMELLERRDFTVLERPLPRLAYMFKHNTTQEVTYEMLLEEQRRELHQAVGEALEDLEPDSVERLAYHYSRSAVRDKTLFYLDKAALRVQAEYANETALNYYNQALALDERWEWRRGQVQVLHILGRRDEERAGLEMLEENATAPDQESEVAYLWAQFYESIGEYPQAESAVERAWAAARHRGDRVSEARCLAQLGWIARRQGDFGLAKDWYSQALALFPDQATYLDEEAQVLARNANGLGVIHRQLGDFDQARVFYERSLALNRGSGDRQGEADVLSSLGGTAVYQGRIAEGLVYHQQALEIRRAIGDRAGEGISVYDCAGAFRSAGDYGQAQQYYLEGLEIQQAIGNRYEENNILNGLGVLYQELGDLRAARDCLVRGLQIAREIGDEEGQAFILSNLGLVLRDQGNLGEAEERLIEGLSILRKMNHQYGICIYHSVLGTVSLGMARFEEAVERAKRALSLCEELDLQLQAADDLATLAAAYLAIGDVDEALANAEKALTILEECGGEGPEAPQRDYYICYQVLTAAGQVERARAALGAAHDLVMARAERITDVDLRQSFLERVQVNRDIVQEYERVSGVT